MNHIIKLSIVSAYSLILRPWSQVHILGRLCPSPCPVQFPPQLQFLSMMMSIQPVDGLPTFHIWGDLIAGIDRWCFWSVTLTFISQRWKQKHWANMGFINVADILSLYWRQRPWCWCLKHHHLLNKVWRNLLASFSIIVIVLYGVQYYDNRTPPPTWTVWLIASVVFSIAQIKLHIEHYGLFIPLPHWCFASLVDGCLSYWK